MGVNTARFRMNQTTDATRLPSANIWSGRVVCPWNDIMENVIDGIAFYDDFTDLPLAPTLTTQIAFGKYKAFANTGCTISKVSPVNAVEVWGGAANIAIDTDNDAVILSHAYPSFLLSGLTSNSGPLWFEVCYAQNSIATNMAAGFFGLAEVEQFTLANTVPFNAGDPITNGGSFIGFRIEEDGLGVVDTVISDRATSFTNIGDTEGGTLVANTFKKFGFVYDPDSTDRSRMIRFFANNSELATAISYTTLTGYTNLDANALGFMWGHVADSAGTAFSSYLKWVKIAQLGAPLGST